MESAVRLYTKYSLQKSKTARLSLLKRVSAEHPEIPLQGEKEKFFELVIIEEQDKPLRDFALGILHKLKGYEVKPVKTAGRPPAKPVKIEQNFRFSVQRENFHGPPAQLNSELKKHFAEQCRDPFFSEVPFLNYLRRDLREIIRKILKKPPVFGFFQSKQHNGEAVYTLEKSLDLQLFSGLIPLDRAFFAENHLLDPVARLVPELYYTLVLLDPDGLTLIFRGGLEQVSACYMRLPVSAVSDCYYRDNRCFLKLTGEMLVFSEVSEDVSSEMELAVKLSRVLVSAEDLGIIEREKKRLSVELKGRIITQAVYSKRLQLITRLKDAIFSQRNIGSILGNLLSKSSDASNRLIFREYGKELSLLFSDIVGFTKKTQQIGTVGIMGVLALYEKIAENAAVKYSGQIIKKMGDGILFSFEKKENAAQCAFHLLSEIDSTNQNLEHNHRFQIRIVLNSGLIFQKNGDIFGDPVNMISRIEKEAGAGEIVATESFITGISSEFQCQSLGEKNLKGFEEPVTIFRIIKTPEDR
ncbi:MAG: adenylate/guanylate cyclase domain-containing protein [Candidatus Wallbacteria bacterium]|nr:adenylate/guanylate cyclase domain-containing protein [Candidatus Wallbacteria bacterium]